MLYQDFLNGASQMTCRSNDEAGQSARALEVTDVGPDPGFKKYTKYFTTYCKKAVPKKKGIKRDDLEQRSVEVRALPDGYHNIGVGQQLSAKMTNMKGWMYTVDTTLNKDPRYKEDANMKSRGGGLAKVYTSVKARLQALISTTNFVDAETHSFEHVGEMSVSPTGVVAFYKV
ncbi:hypothetical protein B0O99DRAFT_590001 [Bisporella sp. PMI_857]|nr:hypothetical protein B0O99DRAFT_590883 [Bisporella sp. PMI_857]KAH8600321.1 hypothetical protein B0O99DRAFT_590001 [Bisporella sp. PMI_857]